jgi:hypothetical protein
MFVVNRSSTSRQLFHGTNRRMIAGSQVVALIGATIRIVYFLMDPILSNGNLTVAQHLYVGLPGVSLTTQMISVVINICLFRRLREMTSRHARRFDLSMLSLVLILIIASFVRDYYAASRQSFLVYIANQFVVLVFVICAATFFLIFGMRLLHRMLLYAGGKKQQVTWATVVKFMLGSEDLIQWASQRRMAKWITCSSILLFS